MVSALLEELELQQDYLGATTLSSIYLGGGTPSLLTVEELDLLFKKIESLYPIEIDAEITLEANPDDLSKAYLQSLRQTPINRLSIGIQSFSETDLRWMNRAHNAKEANACIENALEAGFDNLTVDLIYGSPHTTDAQWQANMQRVFDYGIAHISCYAMTVEPNTALDHFVKNGKSKPVDEEQSARQFEQLMTAAAEHGYEHYEISNFAKAGYYAKHNSNYWLGKKYLGIGPSAHSFDGESRQWNVAHNAQYMKAIESGTIPFELEQLTPHQRYNEYILTSLRTIWGADIQQIQLFGEEPKKYFLQEIKNLLNQGTVLENNGKYTLTQQGKLLADHIAVALFVEV